MTTATKTAPEKKAKSLWLTGPIGDGYPGMTTITAKAVMDALAETPAGPLNVYLNSPGGVVDEALTVRQMLRDCGRDVTITVTGLAASAATLITSTPGAKVIMSRGSLMMIHNPAGGAYGDQHVLRRAADMTEKLAEEVREIYASRSGLPPERVEQMMNEETWLNADEAVELGFADGIDEMSAVTASVNERFIAIGGEVFSREFLPHLPAAMATPVTTEKTPMQKEKTAPEARPEAQKAEITTAEQLMAAFPSLCASLKQSAAEEERKRLQELDELTGTGNDELVMKAKYETVMDARECALILMKDMKGRLAAQRQARAADAAELNALKDIETSGGGSSDEEMRSRMMDGVLSYMKK